MGTAFGLECTLDQSFDLQPVVAPAAPVAAPGLFGRWRAGKGQA